MTRRPERETRQRRECGILAIKPRAWRRRKSRMEDCGPAANEQSATHVGDAMDCTTVGAQSKRWWRRGRIAGELCAICRKTIPRRRVLGCSAACDQELYRQLTEHIDNHIRLAPPNCSCEIHIAVHLEDAHAIALVNGIRNTAATSTTEYQPNRRARGRRPTSGWSGPASNRAASCERPWSLAAQPRGVRPHSAVDGESHVLCLFA